LIINLFETAAQISQESLQFVGFGENKTITMITWQRTAFPAVEYNAQEVILNGEPVHAGNVPSSSPGNPIKGKIPPRPGTP
jgi:hypothetical protein